MQNAADPALQDVKADCCPRCLQPVSPKVARCSGCGQPIASRRILPLSIGVAGLLALIFAVFVMYRMVSNEEDANAPAPPDPAAIEKQEDLFPDPPPAKAHASEPAKPERRPPLDER